MNLGTERQNLELLFRSEENTHSDLVLYIKKETFRNQEILEIQIQEFLFPLN